MIHSSSDDHLTPEEAAAFASLPRVESGHDQLAEERTLQALRAAGFFAQRPASTSRRFPLIGAGIAAATLLFASGAVFGHGLAARELASRSTSMDVQEAGTKYVAALVRLSNASKAEPSSKLVEGLEAGTATLRAAAVSLAMIDPEDPVVQRIRVSLDAASGSSSKVFRTASDNSVIWF